MILALASTWTEIKIVSKSPLIDRLYTKGFWRIDGIWFNTVGSFGLSALLGLLFAADGLVVFFAGALSTGLSQAYFSAKSYLNSEGWTWPRAKSVMLEHRDSLMAAREQIINYAKLLLRAAIFTIKVITAPFRAIDWCIKKKNSLKERFS